MSMKIEDDEIKLEPESDEDHDINLEPGSNEDQDIILEPESNDDQDIKLEPESNEDQDINLEPGSNEDQDIKLEPESNDDQDIKLEPESNEDQDINLEPESNEDQDIKLESEINDENEIQNLQMLNASLINNEPCTSSSASGNSDWEEYTKLDTVLAYNYMYRNELLQLENRLCLRLQACQQRLKEIQEEKQKKTFDYTICGKPYFKNKSNLPAPDNEDTILMRESKMYDFSIVNPVTGWTDKEKTKFLKVLLRMSQEKKKIELNSKIEAVRHESEGQKMSLANQKKISMLKRQIDMVEEMDLNEVALPLDEEYDWDLVANKFSYRRDPLEYKGFWKLYLHPTVNKTPWSTSEHTLLLKIASDENLQNWKKIASVLGTGRTSFQCFVYYCTNVNHPIADKKWTKEEEEYLVRIVQYYKAGDYIPWDKVAAAMESRTKVQVYNKYFRLLEFRKGRFLKEEDEVILTCNDKFGADFKKMAKFLPGRSSAQCRNRFQILKKQCASTVWSIDEDRKLIKFLSKQTSSVNYSGIAQHFPDKDRQHIRSRCITLRKWMKLNPNVDIAKAPRRASRDLGHGVSSHDLHSAIKRLKTKIKGEVNEMRIKDIKMNSAESNIDDDITVMLSQEEHEEIEVAKCHALISSDGSDEDQNRVQFNKLDVQNLRKCLTLLRARLDKKKFLKCPLYEKCKGLLEPDQVLAPVIKVKSYSRKKPETILKIGSAPDIWGTKCLPPPTYVFPPNYSTIITLRTMMSSTSTQSETKEEAIFKNSPLFNTDENDLLKERFKTLFLWPMLLANQPPQGTEHPPYVKKKSPQKPPHFDKGDWNAVAIPKLKAKDKVHNVIDLKESASTSNINIDLQSVIDSSNFDRIKF